ncbi:hypothetical protein CR157_05190 [Halomonas sp. LBP4]|nr:hypothetical protein CR157_05190 [Halomonas sp. LBP4]
MGVGSVLRDYLSYGLRATGYGRRATGDGRRATGDGRRATGDGRRANGRFWGSQLEARGSRLYTIRRL